MQRIECPLCEASFPLDSALDIKPETKLKCSQCSNVFLARQSRILDAESDIEEPDRNAPDNEPIQAEPSVNNREEVPVVPIANETELSTSIESRPAESPDPIGNSSAAHEPANVSEAIGDQVDINKTTALARVEIARKKSKQRSLVLIGFLFVTSIGLAFFFWQAINNSNSANNKSASNRDIGKRALEPDTDQQGRRESINRTDSIEPADRQQAPSIQPDNGAGDLAKQSPAGEGTPKSPKPSSSPKLGPAWLPSPTEVLGDQAPLSNNAPVADATPEPDPFAGEPDNSTPWIANGSTTWPTSKIKLEWNAVYPKLVRLIADKPTGKQEALGVIVDTRGWVATSLRAMVGASKIEVRQIRSHNELLDQQEMLTDEVRGVIESDAELDLVLLSVNRKFVVSLDPVRFPEKDVVVGSHRLLLPFFPKTFSRVVLREQVVASRPRFADWNANAQQQLTSAGLSEPDLQLIPYEERLPTLQAKRTLTSESITAGAPLLNPDGDIVGLTTSLRIQGKPIAVPSIHLNSMLKVASGQVKPLNTINSGTKDLGVQTANSKSNVQDKNPLKPLTIKLNQQGSDCETFEWRPNTPAQFQLMCGLLKSTVKLETLASQNQRPIEERDKILDQTNYWLEKMDNGIGDNFDKLDVSKFNQFAIDQIKKKEAFFFVIAKVAYTAFDGPKLNQKDAVTFRIVGTREYVMVPYDNNMPKMLPDSLWLLACYPSQPDPIRFNASGNRRTAFVSRLVFVNGPLQP